MKLIEKLELNLIIAALKDEETLRETINSDVEVIFVLKSTILTIEIIIERIKNRENGFYIYIW